MIEELEQYHQKGGTYVIPVEIMNYWIGEYEDLKSVIDKAIKRLKGLQAINNGFGATISSSSLNDVIKILDGSLEEILRSKE